MAAPKQRRSRYLLPALLLAAGLGCGVIILQVEAKQYGFALVNAGIVVFVLGVALFHLRNVASER